MNEKVLVIRFNSIGDIVLTSPTIEALHNSGFEVHYLTKPFFQSLLLPNPNVYKVWTLDESINKTINDLKSVGFDKVIDLHNTIRSKRIVWALNLPTYTLSKPRIKNWLLTNFKIGFKKQEHIVRRFLHVISPLVGENKQTSLKFYFSGDLPQKISASLPESYVVIAVGAAFATKQIPEDKLIELINSIHHKVVLIGGQDDIKSSKIIEEGISRPVLNLVGQISINDSAQIVKKAICLICGDTGIMHIGAALNVPMINVFGSTHPILGYTPFYGVEKNLSTIIQIDSLKCRPCTKQGRNSCPKGHFKCMRDVSVAEIVQLIEDKN